MRIAIICGVILACLMFVLICPAGNCADIVGGYAVVASSATYADASWKAVIDALVAKHDAHLVLYSGTAFPVSVKNSLSSKMPKYVCFVGKLSELGKPYVQAAYQLSRSIDSDIYGDFIWGIITGYDAADAMRLVEAPPLAVRRGLLKTCGGWLSCLHSGIFHSEVEYRLMGIKEPGQAYYTTNDSPVDDTNALVSQINTNKVDLVVSSGHATQTSWQLHYPNVGNDGMFYSSNGQVYGRAKNGSIYYINSTNPKIYWAPGNCLIGLATSVDHMVPSWIRSGGAVQFAGYVVTTDNGYMGWGVYDFFLDLLDRFTFAESVFLTNQSLLFDQEFKTPGIDQNKLAYDKDVFAFYGDPAYEARVDPEPGGHIPRYDQSLSFSTSPLPNACRITVRVKLNHSVNLVKPVITFLPFHLKGLANVVTNARQVKILNDMVIMQVWAQGDPDLTAGQEFYLSFDCAMLYSTSIKSAKTLTEGKLAGIKDAVVTAAFDDCFYIESEDRAMGIRVDKLGHGVTPGTRVTVYGTPAVHQGERIIKAVVILPEGDGYVAPVGMSNKEVGGGDWAYDPVLKTGQMGITGASGLNNIGLLVTTWGRVTYSEPGFFYIDDGSGIKDGSGHTGIKVYGRVPTAEDPVGKWVKVTGISSCETLGANLIRVIRPCDEDSVKLLR